MEGADANGKNSESGMTALYAAAHYGLDKTIILLLKHGAKINKVTIDKRCTALHTAADKGNLSTVNLLIDKGADLLIADIKGNTALSFAKNKGFTSIVDTLERAMSGQKPTYNKIGKSFIRAMASSAGSVGATALATSAFATVAATAAAALYAAPVVIPLVGVTLTAQTIVVAAYGAAGSYLASKAIRAATYDSDDERDDERNDERNKTWTGWAKNGVSDTLAGTARGAGAGYLVNKVFGEMKKPVENYTSKIAGEEFLRRSTIGVVGNFTEKATKKVADKTVEVASSNCRIM